MIFTKIPPLIFTDHGGNQTIYLTCYFSTPLNLHRLWGNKEKLTRLNFIFFGVQRYIYFLNYAKKEDNIL